MKLEYGNGNVRVGRDGLVQITFAIFMSSPFFFFFKAPLLGVEEREPSYTVGGNAN